MQIRRILQIVTVSLNILIAALTVFSAYGGTVNPISTTIPAIAAMMFPAFLMAQGILIALNLLWHRRLLLLNVLVIAVCWPSITTYSPIHISQPTASASAREFTLMTYNTYGFVDYQYKDEPQNVTINRTLECIIKANPDIVALQECEAITAGRLNISSAQTDSIESLYPYIALSSGGQTVLSKYPIRRLNLHLGDEHSFKAESFELTIDTLKLTLINIHLQSIGLTDADKELYVQLTDGRTKRNEIRSIKSSLIDKLSNAFRDRALQAENIRARLDSIKGPTIVCGDFNDIPGCYAQRVIMGNDMSDAFRVAGRGPAITYHGNRFYFRIDHILYRGPLAPIRVSRIKNPSSDHYPLIATFAIN